MDTVVIAGASGVVGARVLAHLLARGDVSGVTAIGRHLLPVRHDKLRSHVADFNSQAAISALIPETVVHAFCCLGTTMKQAGSKAGFRAVDFDTVLAFAGAARSRGARRLLLVSALGANATSSNLYRRTKGEAEQAVAGLGFAQVTVLRPSLIDDEGARGERRVAEQVLLPIARAVFAIAGRESRYAPIPADTIARAMVHLAFDQTSEPVRIIESEQLHRIGRQAS